MICREALDGLPVRGERTVDGDLVELARAGNVSAFEQLVERHRGTVYRAALAALGHEAEAEDVAQDGS